MLVCCRCTVSNALLQPSEDCKTMSSFMCAAQIDGKEIFSFLSRLLVFLLLLLLNSFRSSSCSVQVPPKLVPITVRNCSMGEVQDSPCSCMSCPPATFSFSPSDTQCHSHCPDNADCLGGESQLPSQHSLLQHNSKKTNGLLDAA